MSTPQIDEMVASLGVLRDTLLDIPDVVSIVGQEVHWEGVEDSLSLPYIVLSHITGGYENSTQANAVDTYWKVIGVTANKAQALAFKLAIGQLHRKELVTVNEPNVTPYSTVRLFTPVSDKDLEQQVWVYQMGGIFRLRFIINPTS